LQFAAFLVLAGGTLCAPSSRTGHAVAPRSAPRRGYAEAGLLETVKRQDDPDQDPDICYGDCILAGGADWPCICQCIGDPDCT